MRKLENHYNKSSWGCWEWANTKAQRQKIKARLPAGIVGYLCYKGNTDVLKGIVMLKECRTDSCVGWDTRSTWEKLGYGLKRMLRMSRRHEEDFRRRGRGEEVLLQVRLKKKMQFVKGSLDKELFTRSVFTQVCLHKCSYLSWALLFARRPYLLLQNLDFWPI